MPTFVVEESSYAGPIPDDTVLNAEVVNVEQKKMPWKKKDSDEDDENMEFSFVVVDVESPYDGQRLWGKTSLKFSTNMNCKLRNWSMAIIGQDLPAETSFNTDVLVGLPCRVVVKQKTYEKDDEEKISNFVADVLQSRNAPRSNSYEDEPF